MKLQQHVATKKEAVRGWDILSAGMGITGFFLIASCLVQPKAKINAIRLPAAVIMLAGSCAAERLRESDLLSLDKAIEFERGIVTEKIRKDTLLRETIDDLRSEEELFVTVPRDRWGDLAERTGIMPPNIEARQAMQPQNGGGQAPATQVMEPPVQSELANAADPTPQGYDPEEAESDRQGDRQSEIQDCIVFADQVAAWFKEKGDLVPESLIAEWQNSPGIAIKVEDGRAIIVRREV
ncbi:MAG: hypothetical protein ACRC62_14010 [Microcoleus sp.]